MKLGEIVKRKPPQKTKFLLKDVVEYINTHPGCSVAEIAYGIKQFSDEDLDELSKRIAGRISQSMVASLPDPFKRRREGGVYRYYPTNYFFADEKRDEVPQKRKYALQDPEVQKKAYEARMAKRKAGKPNTKKQALLIALATPYKDLAEVCERANISRASLWWYLDQLIKENKVKRFGHGDYRSKLADIPAGLRPDTKFSLSSDVKVDDNKPKEEPAPEQDKKPEPQLQDYMYKNQVDLDIMAFLRDYEPKDANDKLSTARFGVATEALKEFSKFVDSKYGKRG